MKQHIQREQTPKRVTSQYPDCWIGAIVCFNDWDEFSLNELKKLRCAAGLPAPAAFCCFHSDRGQVSHSQVNDLLNGLLQGLINRIADANHNGFGEVAIKIHNARDLGHHPKVPIRIEKVDSWIRL